MFEKPPGAISMPLCALLASLAIAIALPAFANEPVDESAAAKSDLAPEPALDVAPDLSAVEEFESQMDEELTADVSRMLDAIVAERTAQQMRWLAQHYFDHAAAGGRVSPVALVSPTGPR
jgi:hypothetical protein